MCFKVTLLSQSGLVGTKTWVSINYRDIIINYRKVFGAKASSLGRAKYFS
jgi:hypothetical protein